MKRLAVVATVLALALLARSALADGVPAIHWRVVAGGGGHAKAAPYALDGTAGQPLVGTAEEGSYWLCSGFWCEVMARHHLRLPLVLRNHH